MPAKYVPLATDEIYHVFNRGVDKRVIYNDNKDYIRFYESLYYFNCVEPTTNLGFAKIQNYKSVQKLVAIEAYCLLPNHFHLLVKQKVDGGISEFIRRITSGYASYYNLKHKRNGALFQGKFKRVHIQSNEQYNYLLAYVNENHVVHKLPNPTEVFQTSGMAYTKGLKSKVLNEVSGQYNQKEGRAVARDIYKKRQKLKYLLDE